MTRLLLLALLLFSQLGVVVVQRGAPAGTPVTMQIFASTETAPSGTQYVGLFGGANATATEDASAQVIPTAGSLKSSRCYNFGGTADSGENMTLAVRRYTGGSWSDILTCSMTGDATTSDTGCVDTSSVSVAAGDLVVFKQVVTGGTPTVGEDCVPSVLFTATANDTSLVMGNSPLNSSAANYMSPVGGVVNTTRANVIAPTVDSFTVTGFYVDTDVNLTTDRTFTVCYDDDGATDAACNTAGRSYLSCTVTAGTQTCNDTSCDQGSCAVVAAKEWFIAASTGTAQATNIGWGIALTQASQHWQSLSAWSSTNTGASTTGAIDSGAGSGSGNLANINNYIELNPTALAMYVWHDGVTTGTSKTVALNVNGSTSALSCAVTSSLATCSNTTPLALTAGNRSYLEITPVGTPASNNMAAAISWTDLE